MCRSWSLVVAGLAVFIATEAPAQPEPGPDAGAADAEAVAPAEDPCDALEHEAQSRTSPAALLAAGACREERGQLTQAWYHYIAAAEVAARDKDDAMAGTASRLEGKLRTRTVSIDIDRARVEQGAWVSYSVDGLVIPDQRLGRTIRLTPGVHYVRAVRPGCDAFEQEILGQPGQRVRVAIPELRCFAGEQSGEQRRADATASRRGLYIAVVGGASAVATVILAVESRGERARASRLGCDEFGSCLDDEGRKHLQRADDLRFYAVGTGAAAVVGVGIGLWLYYGSRPSSPKQDSVSVSPAIAPGGAGLVLEGAF